MTSPGKVNAAQHVHDYVGNTSTDAFTTDESLAAADTTCERGDLSTYFWPVLRATDRPGADANADGGGLDGNVGEILQPISVNVEFRGSPTGTVTTMPQFLEIITGDAKAKTNGDEADDNAQWTCTGFEDRISTDQYPRCPVGSDLVRILEFPSCWDGENAVTEDRSHIAFPEEDGSCEDGMVAVPKLHIELTYDRPNGTAFALDSFPDQQHDPRTDHGQFENVMPEALMATAVDCINTGRDC
ncbi:MAG: DUF1996 domain-containing protein [Pseudonocardiaceae bacterium]|nr:DUF1996 domain-containing protein [Pseudonocardiaceae bacterium]